MTASGAITETTDHGGREKGAAVDWLARPSASELPSAEQRVINFPPRSHWLMKGELSFPLARGVAWLIKKIIDE